MWKSDYMNRERPREKGKGFVRLSSIYAIASHNFYGSQSRTILFGYPAVSPQHDNLMKYGPNKSVWLNVPA